MENSSKESILSMLVSLEATKNGRDNCPPWQKSKWRRTQKQILNFSLNKEKSNLDEDSEEDKKELLEAVEMHLKNKPEKKKTDSVDVSRYETLGAIPKLRKQENVDGKKKRSKTKSRLKILDTSTGIEHLPTDEIVKKNSNSSEKILTNPNDQGIRIRAVQKYGVSRLHIMNPRQPFLYIVPENPSPYFTLPAGSYYVTTDDLRLPPVDSIVSHPEDSSAGEKIYEIKNSTFGSQNKLNKMGSTFSTIPFKNNLVRCEDGKERTNTGDWDGSLTRLEKFEDFESALLTGDFDKIDIPIDILKSRLKAKINALNVALENLSLLRTIEKIEPDLFSKTVVYTKQFGKSTSDSRKEEITQDKIFILELLFPHSDRGVLRKEVEECDGSEPSFLDLVKRKIRGVVREADIHPGFSLLFNQLPDHDLEILYYKWLECLGNEEKLKTFVDEENKILEFQQIIQAEMPEMSVLETRKRAENFFYDECAWGRFLAERRCLKKIEEQFLRMRTALPEMDPAELLTKCQELEGEEDLISEYILDVQCQMKKEAHFLIMQSVLPDAQPDFLREKIKEAEGDDQRINVLTNSLLENNDYPKVEVDSGAIERQKLWQTYVDNFDVKDFLLETEGDVELGK